jgi:hypothetical protein
MVSFGFIGSKTCLIGGSGFVGGTLRRQTTFSSHFNSKNIFEVQGQNFDTVVCAAAPGSMFEANKFPERDEKKVHDLIRQLSKVQAGRFILISSIAVLRDFAGGDDETTTSFQEELAYGQHRRELESFVENHFPSSLIVRLPALFGRGLRKNFVFDLLNPVPSMLTSNLLGELTSELDRTLATSLNGFVSLDAVTGMYKIDRAELNRSNHRLALEEAIIALGLSSVQFHNPETTYQYYDMRELWSDIQIALEKNLSHIHLVNEPIRASRIHEDLTGRTMPATAAPIHNENMQTRFSELWNSKGPYLRDQKTVRSRLKEFFDSERKPA